jgi:hypothetical protein
MTKSVTLVQSSEPDDDSPAYREIKAQVLAMCKEVEFCPEDQLQARLDAIRQLFRTHKALRADLTLLWWEESIMALRHGLGSVH